MPTRRPCHRLSENRGRSDLFAMQLANHPPRRLRFGIFEADPRLGELTKHGKRLPLQEQPFQLLAMLLERPGELVSREELRAKIWPQTIVDFDHGLNKAISKIRDALGDSAENPRFIETVARRGYRFLADVAVVQDGPRRKGGRRSGSAGRRRPSRPSRSRHIFKSGRPVRLLGGYWASGWPWYSQPPCRGFSTHRETPPPRFAPWQYCR